MMVRPALVALLLPLLTCACAGVVRTSARYTGPAPECGRIEGGGTTATLSRLGGSFAFAPYDGSVVINGKVAPDGTLSGTLALRPAEEKPESGTAPHAPRPPQLVSVSGRLTPETATVRYAAPDCTAQLALTRVHPPLL